MDEEPSPQVGWAAVAGASMDGLGVTVDGAFTRANDALAATFGCEEPAALVGDPWRQWYQPEEHDRLADVVADVVDGSPWRGRVTGRRADGSAVAQELSLRRGAAGEAVVWAVRDVEAEVARERELERFETLVDTLDDGVYVLDEELRFTFVNDAVCRMAGRPREEMVGTPVAEFFRYDEEYDVAEDIRERVLAGDTSVGTAEGTVVGEEGTDVRLEARYRLHPEPDGAFRGSVGVLRDVTERVQRERELERQRDELATVDRINRLLLDVVRELVRTPTREAVERTVCERLTDAERYRFAWIGQRAFDADRIAPRTTAGAVEGFLDAVPFGADAETAGDEPVGRALRTGRVQVANAAASSAPWGEAALDRGFRSTVAVPIRHDDTVYAALAVYASRADAFTEREQEGIAILGETIGYIINAIRNRRLLFADSVVELAFDVTDGESLLARTAATLECTLSLVGVVDTGSSLHLYVEVDDVAPEAVLAAVADEPALERSRVIAGEGDRRRVALTLADSPLVGPVRAAGATLESAVVDPRGARLVVEAPAAADIRDVVATVRAGFDRAELVARRARDRSGAEAGLPASLLDGLTDRRRRALEIAYHSGYFEWPRASTAEEVADSMGIAAPTLHYHLRKGESGLLSVLFD